MGGDCVELVFAEGAKNGSNVVRDDSIEKSVLYFSITQRGSPLLLRTGVPVVDYREANVCYAHRSQDEARVTKKDFRRYYDEISATVPDDGYFELLLRTCWRMYVPYYACITFVQHEFFPLVDKAVNPYLKV